MALLTYPSSLFLSVKKLYRSLSLQKVLILWLSLLISVIFFVAALVVFNSRFLITVPARGGTLSEGIMGTPRFINPVLATSQQDKDLTALVYAGLTKRDEHGMYIPDIAESIQKSDDSLEYDVTLKSWARFHDGTKVTADDILYTISLVQDPYIKSPHLIEWEGVSVEKVSDLEVKFTLKQPYPLFEEALSLGILPKHLWKNLTEDQISLSDYNVHAVGAGPFQIDNVVTSSGISTEFDLSSHKYYTLGRPYLDGITIHIYDTEKSLIAAYNNGDITRMYGVSPADLSQINSLSGSTILTSRLPREFSIFLNPNKADFLSDKNVRKALSLAIDRNAIIDDVYKGYALSLTTPFPFDEANEATTSDLVDAKILLAGSKYFKNASSTVQITLTTTNNPDLRAVADEIKKAWGALGVQTQILVYEPSDINQKVIKERDFQSLLYGSLIMHPSDLFAFYHSSQRTYPGLNISSYVSQSLDGALSGLRTTEDAQEATPEYEAIKKEFNDETPGIFLYSPKLIYITDDRATTPLPENVLDTSLRFSLSEQWYQKTEHIWKGTYYPNLIGKLENILH